MPSSKEKSDDDIDAKVELISEEIEAIRQSICIIQKVLNDCIDKKIFSNRDNGDSADKSGKLP